MKPFDLTNGDHIIAQGVQANKINGMNLSVRTDLDSRVSAWRAAPDVVGDSRFFCHGYSLGTFGPFRYTVWGSFVPRVLADEYQALGPIDAAQNVVHGDILVWWKALEAYHSAVVEQPHFSPTGVLDLAATQIRSKTGTGPLWIGILAEDVKKQYHQAGRIEVYRRNA
jgi:hypothetical protein